MNKETQGTPGRGEGHLEGEGRRRPVVEVFAALPKGPGSNQQEGLVGV